MIQHCKTLLRAVGALLSHVSNAYLFNRYEIHHIDLSTHQVTIRCRGKNSVIKRNIQSIINDSAFLNALTPYQACIIGGCLGRLIESCPQLSKRNEKFEQTSFLLEDEDGDYAILYQNRAKQIGYVHKRTAKEFVESPITLSTTKHIINKFSPSQACYIGILAGLSLERAEKSDIDKAEEMLNTKPKIRAVD